MAKQTYFVVQSFERSAKGGLAARVPIQVQSREQAIRLADREATRYAGVIAFSRTGDPSTGDYGDAVILATLGHVPEEVLDAA